MCVKTLRQWTKIERERVVSVRNNVSECEKEETVSVIVQLIKVSKSERERERGGGSVRIH